jgi:hypothetical protein
MYGHAKYTLCFLQVADALFLLSRLSSSQLQGSCWILSPLTREKKISRNITWMCKFMFLSARFLPCMVQGVHKILFHCRFFCIIPLALLMISLMFDTLHSHRRIVQYKTSYYSFYLPVSVSIVYLISLVVMLSSNSILCSYFAQGCMCIAAVGWEFG